MQYKKHCNKKLFSQTVYQLDKVKFNFTEPTTLLKSPFPIKPITRLISPYTLSTIQLQDARLNQTTDLDGPIINAAAPIVRNRGNSVDGRMSSQLRVEGRS